MTTSRWDRLVVLLATLLVMSLPVGAQTLSSGIIASGRATDWTQAGVQGMTGGALPSDTWTQCLPTITTADIVAAGGVSTPINTQLAGCAANTYVLLGPGTYSFTGGGGIVISRDNVELRGSGGDQTFLASTVSFNTCGGANAYICIRPTSQDYYPGTSNLAHGNVALMPGGTNAFNWTAGYAPGTTSITITNVGTSGLSVGKWITLSQMNDMVSDGTVADWRVGDLTLPATSPTAPTNHYYCLDCAPAGTASADGSSTVTWVSGTNNTHFSVSWNAGTFLRVNNVSYTLTGSPPCTSTACTVTTNVPAGNPVPWAYATDQFDPTGGFSLESAPPGLYLTDEQVYSQTEKVQITAITSNTGIGCTTATPPVCTGVGPFTVTITPAIEAPNWKTANVPIGWWAGTIKNVGIRDFSLDFSGAPNSGNEVSFGNTVNGWSSGVRTIRTTGRDHYNIGSSAHITIQNCYLFGPGNAGPAVYGIEASSGHYILAQNNIYHQVGTLWVDANCADCVIAYNWGITPITAGSGLGNSMTTVHDAGGHMNLFEGNQGEQVYGDPFHGNGNATTFFRNRETGFQAGKTSNLNTIILAQWNRFNNIIGNVLGTANKQDVYDLPLQSGYVSTTAGSTTVNWQSGAQFQPTAGGITIQGTQYNVVGGSCSTITCTLTTPFRYTLAKALYIQTIVGAGGTQAIYRFYGSPLNNIGFDPQVATTLMRWGNCDAVTGFGPGLCKFSNSEVPSGLSILPNPVPASQFLPPSFYMTAKPAWFGSIPFPVVGPDVTGGNLPGVNGTAFLNPAGNCALNVMGEPADGSGTVLNFNAAVCYVSSTSAGPPGSVRVNVGITVGPQHQALLSWTKSVTSDVTAYNIYRSTTSGTGYVKIGTVTAAFVQYLDKTTLAGKTYFYVITSVNPAGESAYSTQVQGTIGTP